MAITINFVKKNLILTKISKIIIGIIILENYNPSKGIVE